MKFKPIDKMWMTPVFCLQKKAMFCFVTIVFLLSRGDAVEVKCDDLVDIEIPQDKEWGIFETQGYSSDGLPADRDCGWLITNPSGLRVSALVFDINLPDSQTGTVRMWKGSNTGDINNYMMSALKGNVNSDIATSDTGTIYIEYLAGNSANAQGFKTLFVLEQETWDDLSYGGCSNTANIQLLPNQVKYLTSDKFPLMYSSSSDCKWIVISDNEKKIVEFRLRWLNLPVACQDKLKIYDAGDNNDEASLMFETCGDRKIDFFKGSSTGQKLTLTFTSDIFVERTGFFMELWSQTVRKDMTVSVPEEQQLNTLESPGYSDGNIPTDESFGWKIVNPNSGLKVYVIIADVQMAQTQTAFVKVYKGNDIANSDNELSPVITGESYNSDIYTSDTGEVFIYFNTGHSPVGRGFKVYYVIEVPNQLDYSFGGCSSTKRLTAKQILQYLTSENFPGLYSQNSNCQWIIDSGSYNKRIKLVVLWLYLDASGTGCSDLLKIFDSDSTSGVLILQPCGEREISAYDTISTGRYLTITFTSNDQIEHTGFFLNYSTTNNKANDVRFTNTMTIISLFIMASYY